MKHNTKEMVERFEVLGDLQYRNDDGADMHIVEEIIQSHIDLLDDLVEEIGEIRKRVTGEREDISERGIGYREALQDTITHLLERKEELKELIK